MTEEQQIQAALLAAGGLAGEAAACNFSDRTDYHIAFAFMETLRKRWPEMINKATEAFATGYGSAFGAVTKDRNFPSVCATQVKEFLNGETARDVRAFLIQRTKP